MQRIVGQIRAAWPEVRIILRGDSGFCRNELMSWCEQNGVAFVFGCYGPTKRPFHTPIAALSWVSSFGLTPRRTPEFIQTR